jgi:hypothetical protein
MKGEVVTHQLDCAVAASAASAAVERPQHHAQADRESLENPVHADLIFV